MKSNKSVFPLVYMVFLILVFVPCRALAQEVPPPPCCDKEPPPGGNSAVGGETQNQVVMADSALLALGISRSQFLDRLAAGLFPGQDITLTYTVTTTVSVPADPSSTDKSPVLVQITYQYRVQRSQMKPEEIDALDQFVITDGATYIQIKFTQTQLVIPPQ
jgi:hypothetical protein